MWSCSEQSCSYPVPAKAARNVSHSTCFSGKQPQVPNKQSLRQGHGQRSSRSALISQAAATRESLPISIGEIVDVEDIEGIRVLIGEENKPFIEYLVKWKDEIPPTWEPVENLADNLLRDFEEKWWKSCRERSNWDTEDQQIRMAQGDEASLQKLLEHSKEVLPHCVDTDNRSALHFAAALGKADICKRLCEAGAEVDHPDKDELKNLHRAVLKRIKKLAGYTALHMAVGYSHVSTVKILLDAGANPEIPDTQGRNVIQLVDSIRDQLPLNPQLASKRIALEEVSALLTGNLFEEVLPKRILESRATASGGREYLIQWLDGAEDSWVKDADVAKDVMEDFSRGLEYADAELLLKMKMRGDQRLFLVRWMDNSPDSWEFEDNLSPVLVAAFDKAKADGRNMQDVLAEAIAAPLPVSKRAARRAKKASKRAAELSGHVQPPEGPESAHQEFASSNGNGHMVDTEKAAEVNSSGVHELDKVEA